MQRIDMTGKRFGLLTVVEYFGYDRPNGLAQWRCICDCGNTIVALGKNLRQGNTQSCGCLRTRIGAALLKKRKESPAHA